jgi:hypothetical protein
VTWRKIRLQAIWRFGQGIFLPIRLTARNREAARACRRTGWGRYSGWKRSRFRHDASSRPGPAVVSPIASWAIAANGGSTPIRPQHVLDACNYAIGTLSAWKSEAEQREKSLAGRLAWFIRLPREVREAAGFQADSRSGRVALWFAVAIEAGAGLIVASLLATIASIASG